MTCHHPKQGELFAPAQIVTRDVDTTIVPPSLWQRLARSRFRSQFHLNGHDRDYLEAKGLTRIIEDGRMFIRKRLAPAHPSKDGRQTPWKGHPVFVAQHATGNCCRSCLYKWHKIPKGHELTEQQQQYIITVLRLWLEREESLSKARFEKNSSTNV